MKPIANFVSAMSDSEIEQLYDGALSLLEEPGMKIDSAGLRKALRQAGAVVDDAGAVVKFPRKMIKAVVVQAAAEEKARLARCGGNTVEADHALTFSWHAAPITRTPAFDIAMGGGCPLFYDYPTKSARYGNEADLVRLLHLAEGIPQIRRCGNPIHCIQDRQGQDVPKDLMALQTAAIVAKNSSKPGVTALMSVWQLEYSVAMGEVIRKSSQTYQNHPIFININDTVPPLQLSEPEGDIIEALAKRALPVYILPMPMMGVTNPVTVFASAMTGIAEILGVWAAAKAVNPDTPLECSVVSGVLEPTTGNACFSAPEAAAIDLVAAQFFRSLGLRCGTGVGLIDASSPGAAAVFERTLKSTITAMAGESTYVVGILGAGNIFSAEQMMLDIDIGSGHHQFMQAFDGADLKTAVGLIRDKGIGGFHMDSEHTLSNFRQRIWMPGTFQRRKTNNPRETADPVAGAYEKWNDILANTEPYHLPDDQAKEIDKILARAKKSLGQA